LICLAGNLGRWRACGLQFCDSHMYLSVATGGSLVRP
jgi:hypothetical protein